MKLDDAEQAKYEALAEAANVAIEPLAKFAETWTRQDRGHLDKQKRDEFEHALDESVLAIMDLVDKAYKQGRHDNNQEWLEVEHAHFEQ